jgi:hypothetical protein
MPYPEKMLNDGESVTVDLHPHWWFFAEPVVVLLGAIAIGIVVLVGTDDGSDVRNWLGLVSLALIVISVQETTPEDVRRYVETYELDYTVGFDATSAIFATYQAYGLPTQLFLDRDGVIRTVVRGPLSEIEAERILAPLLAG